jgi:hypothetical protein
MSRSAAAGARRYETTVRDVREVSLVGLADPAPWAETMAPEGLRPLPVDGRAEILLLASASTYMGVRFRELAVAVTLAQPTRESALAGAFMARGWNSVRFFAYVERAWFKTPYEPAEVSVDNALPASFGASRQGASLLRARMAARPTVAEPGADTWEGTVFLPRPADSRDPLGKLFFVRLRGVCREHPWAPADTLEIGPAPDEVLALLTASDFTPRLWRVRTGAEHSRSRSYARAPSAAFETGA